MFSLVTFVAFLAAAPGPLKSHPDPRDRSPIPTHEAGSIHSRPPEDTRISIDLKETSIIDIVRLLAEVGGFQVVMDPGISCHPTLKLHEVPWPTVFDVALRTCRLSYEEDNGIIRVATAARLMQEANDRRKLAEEQALARPLRTTRYRLSYARAEQMAAIIKKFLSPRGEVVVDPRTNTLIITDIE